MQPTFNLSSFLDQVTTWATSRPDVFALALAGSHARGTARPDSDVDLILLCEEPQRYVQDADWVNLFGTPERMQVEDYGRLVSLRVWYTGGPEVEFGLSDRGWALPIDPGSDRVIMDGVRLLFERAPVLSPAMEDFSQAEELAATLARDLRQAALAAPYPNSLHAAQYAVIWKKHLPAIRRLALRARLHIARGLILTLRQEEANLANAILADCALLLGPEHFEYLDENARLLDKMGETPPAFPPPA